MIPIKKIAGDVLLLLYVQQRKDAKLSRTIISFDRNLIDLQVQGNDELKDGVLKISNSSVIDAYNAFKYLEESGFISYKESLTNMSKMLVSPKVTANGVDVIEAIERGPEEKNNFFVNFNIQVNNNTTVESLVKAEIGSLIKAALL